jgi:hypothetical protein
MWIYELSWTISAACTELRGGFLVLSQDLPGNGGHILNTILGICQIRNSASLHGTKRTIAHISSAYAGTLAEARHTRITEPARGFISEKFLIP